MEQYISFKLSASPKQHVYVQSAFSMARLLSDSDQIDSIPESPNMSLVPKMEESKNLSKLYGYGICKEVFPPLNS